MHLTIAREVKEQFPELRVVVCIIRNVKVEKTSERLKKFIAQKLEDLRKRYSTNDLQKIPVLKFYRDLLKQTLGKDTSSVVALVKRALGGEAFPIINNLVDACNLAVAETLIAMGAFDLDKISGDMILRLAVKGESFLEIGKKDPMELHGGEVIISDSRKIFSIPIYRDGEETKISEETKYVALLALGVEERELLNSIYLAMNYITEYCGGRGEVKLVL